MRAKDGGNVFSIRSGRYDLMWDTTTDKTELYDVIADPLEKNNLFPSELDIEATLQDKLYKRIEGYERARIAGGQQGDAVLDPEIERKLRALGYLR